MSSELQIALVAGVVQCISFFIAYKKLGYEKAAILAGAQRDEASADKTWAETVDEQLESHQRLYQILQDRETEIISIRERVRILEGQMAERESQLAAEIELRIATEIARDELKQEVAKLKEQVCRLEAELKELKELKV
jgi:hypothetical protein